MVVQQRQHMNAVGGCTIFMSACLIFCEYVVGKSRFVIVAVCALTNPLAMGLQLTAKSDRKKPLIKQKALKLSSV